MKINNFRGGVAVTNCGDEIRVRGGEILIEGGYIAFTQTEVSARDKGPTVLVLRTDEVWKIKEDGVV